MNMNGSKIKKISIVTLLILLFVGGSFAYKHFQKDPKNIVAGTFLPDGKDAKEMSADELKKAAELEIDASTFTLSIYPEATFEDGKSTGALYIRNEPTNAYPIAVEIVHDVTDEIIYESGAIQPGYEITEGKLSKNLSKGIYVCTANVSIFDPETEEFKGQSAAEVVVEVKN